MIRPLTCCAALASAIALAVSCPAQTGHAYRYFRVGNTADATLAHPRPGYALMGGGADLDQAFQWLCDRAGGGDFLVLRATGDDDYNPYIQKLCPRLNSIATLIIPNRAAAEDPFVASTIRTAEAVFIAGGDQANYVRFWGRTAAQTALNDQIHLGIPIGGTSAGLAVMGEFGYSAEADKPDDPNLDSKTALANPYGSRVTFVHGLLSIPLLDRMITDTHFVKRNRMGRLLAFLANLHAGCRGGHENYMPLRGIGVDEGAAVLVDADGRSLVVGKGDVYFIDARLAEWTCGKTLSGFGPLPVQKVSPGHTFNLKTWTGESRTYQLSVKNGQITSTQQGGAIY